MVYGSFRYLLVPALPFLLGWAAASRLRPAAMALSRRFVFLKEGAAAGFLLLVFSGVTLAGAWFLGKALWQQGYRVLQGLPEWLVGLEQWLVDCCHGLENSFSLEEGTLLKAARDAYEGAVEAVRESSLKYMMDHSWAVVAGFGAFFAGVAVTVLAVIFQT